MPKPLDRAGVCRSWGCYFRAVADLMWLRDWTITIVDAQPPDGAYAAVECLEGRKRALISLSDAFFDDLSEEDRRQIVVHELAHCHFDHAAVLAHKAMGERYSDFLVALEYGIDGIADAFAARLPLPSHVKPRPNHEGTNAMAKGKGKTGTPMPTPGKAVPKGLKRPANGTTPLAKGKGKKMGGRGC